MTYPANDLRKETAASPDAACSVNASMTYVWMHWKLRIMPAPRKAVPCIRACTVQLHRRKREQKKRVGGGRGEREEAHDVGHEPENAVLCRPAVQE